MYKILKAEFLASNIFLMEIEAPRVAKSCEPGQFIIAKIDENGERIPLTISDYDRERGMVQIVVQVIGASTKKMSELKTGDYLEDFVGPLGCPSDLVTDDIEDVKKKKILFVAGGLGTAPVYPQVKWLHEHGIAADVIVGAKTKDLVILEKEMQEVAGNLYITTDDGSYGRGGMVTDTIKYLVNDLGKEYDHCVAIGPMIMMKFVCLLTKELGIHTVVSVNPIMVDGTGMCGACRVQVGNEVKFACVDGPEFDGHLVDFTNPDACKWYQDKLEALIDMGVDCFKTDFGERIPTDCVYYNGMDAHKMHNYYTYLYNKTVFDLLERKKGKGQAVLFARSATAGGQKFPVHWGGDCWSDYESMEESLRGGLSLQMSGFGFWSHDIGGFESTSTPDVYKRWCAFGLLSSHSRLHGSTSYRVPWAYDEEAVDVVRFFTRLKARLMPYIYKTAVQARTQGVPSMRSMVLEFTGDRMCNYIDRQYMFGDSLLVAPIFNEDSIGEYYLPSSEDGKTQTWTNFFTGEEQISGKWYTGKYGYCDIPLMARPNSIIAVGASDNGPEYDYADNVLLRIFALEDGKEASTEVYDMDGNLEFTAKAVKEGNKITIKTDAKKPYKVELVNASISSVTGAKLEDGKILTDCAGTIVAEL